MKVAESFGRRRVCYAKEPCLHIALSVLQMLRYLYFDNTYSWCSLNISGMSKLTVNPHSIKQTHIALDFYYDMQAVLSFLSIVVRIKYGSIWGKILIRWCRKRNRFNDHLLNQCSMNLNIISNNWPFYKLSIIIEPCNDKALAWLILVWYLIFIIKV